MSEHVFFTLYRWPYPEAAAQVRLGRHALLHVWPDVRNHLHGQSGARHGLDHASAARLALHLAAGVGGGLPDGAAGDTAGQAHHHEAGAVALGVFTQPRNADLTLALQGKVSTLG